MTTQHYWRLLDYSSEDPAMNLAIEEAILRCLLEHSSPNTLRLWQNPPSVIIGRFQISKSEVNIVACKKLGIDILRRVSGGGAVYHDYGNLNYSLIAHKSSLNFQIDNVEKSYDLFCSGVIEGLKMLDIDAYNLGGDIMINGKKVSGSAQHRLYDAILHHGTLMVDVNFDILGRTLRVSDPRRYLINLYDVLPRKVSLNEIKRAIKKGFEKRFNVKFKKRKTLFPRERQTAKRLYEIRYRKRDWNKKRKVEGKGGERNQ
jgi:lipoate-protein ligase A